MTNFHWLSEKGGGFPIVVDDSSPDKFKEPKVQIIKNDFRVGVYPVLGLSSGRKGGAVGGYQTGGGGPCGGQHADRDKLKR